MDKKRPLEKQQAYSKLESLKILDGAVCAGFLVKQRPRSAKNEMMAQIAGKNDIIRW